MSCIMNIKYFLALITFYFVKITKELNLIPDSHSPLQMPSPTNSANGATIVFRFSFPSASSVTTSGPLSINSAGLTYGQFIGVSFPENLGDTDLTFDQGGSVKYSCSLTDGTYTYLITPVLPTASPNTNTYLYPENFVAYCRLDDINNTKVPLKPGILFTFSITLSSVRIASTNYVRGVTLFTSTSNNPERIIIDSLPMFGTLLQYPDWVGYTPKALDIVSATLTPTIIYPYTTFSTTITLKANSFLNIAEILIVFRFPTDTVTAANSVSSSAVLATNPLQANLKGTPTIKPFGTNAFYIDGITENFIANRTFILTLSGWTALDNNIGTAKNLELIVFYKNTQVILSYKASSIFLVTKASLAGTANHPEYWDIFRNGAWPISFSFTSNTVLNNGGYVQIQHSNNIDTQNKISFLAATCDFSQNLNSNTPPSDQTFGKRPLCYPLRRDFIYTGTNGSGFFFRINTSISANKPIYVTIWAFADACGSTFDPVNTLATATTLPSFLITIYKSINPLAVNESRLNTQVVIAQSPSITFNGVCYNNRMQGISTPIPYFYDYNFLQTISADNSTPTSSKPTIMLYREVHDWQLQSQTNAFSCNACWGSGMDQLFANEKFLYSSQNKIDSGSYFLIRFQFLRSSNPSNDKLLNYLPLPYTFAGGKDNMLPGKLVIQFSSAWFSTGDAFTGSAPTQTCYISYGAFDTTNAGKINSQKNLIYSINDVFNSSQNNIIGANTVSGPQIDSTLTNIPSNNANSGLNNSITSASNIFRIVSAFNNGSFGPQTWKYFQDFNVAGDTTTSKIQVGFYTTCVKWTSNFPTIKSLYTYIDVQIKWNLVYGLYSSLGTTINNTRLIKLFIEGGVFQDFQQIAPVQTNPITQSPFINHLAYVGASGPGVCLIELDGSAVQSLGDVNLSNTFIVSLMGASLLESDYSDASSTYPVPNVLQNISTFGLQSAPGMSTDNLYINVTNLNTYLNLPYVIATTNSQTPNYPINTPLSPLIIGSNRTSYLFYLGSAVYFTNITSQQITSSSIVSNLAVNPPIIVPNIIFPYYCPNLISGAPSLGVLPTVIGTWLAMSSHSLIRSVNKVLTFRNTSDLLYYTLLLPQYSLKGNGVTLNPAISYTTTLRFQPYTTPASTTLYIYNGYLSSQNNQLNCTGFSLFLSSSISLSKPSFTINSNTIQLNTYASSIFYIFGKVFNKAILYSQGLTVISIPGVTPISNLSTSVYYSGINRPTVDTYVLGTSISTNDKISFFCTSSGLNDFNFISNYVPTNNIFILDFNPNTSAIWGTTKISLDNPNIYQNDYAGNINLSITTPAMVPTNAQIVFSLNNGSFSSDTLCGIIAIGSFARSCNNLSGTITCTVPATSNLFSICCYSVIINSLAFSLANLQITLPSLPYMSSLIYDAKASGQLSNYNYDTQNSNLLAINGLTGKNAFISNAVYSQSNQTGSIGKLALIVSLPRQPTRDMKLTIEGDLSGLWIPGSFIPPRCLATFGSSLGGNWDSGDILIDTCSVNNFQSAVPIVIITKRILYKCGISFSQTLTVYLWPVVIKSFTSTTPNNNFKVTMSVNFPSPPPPPNNALAVNTQLFNLITNVNDSTLLKVTGQWENLCFVSVISPKIPGEKADYQFDIDLELNSSLLTGSTINELTIFWPYQYYGSTLNVICYTGGIRITCTFADEGILNISFTSPLQVGKKTSVIVAGVHNPVNDIDYAFPCTVNFTTNSRIVVASGSGRINGGINMNNILITGSLKFSPVSPQVSDKNTRVISTHTFRVGIDTALGISSTSLTVTTPVFYFYFPNDYKLYIYPTPTVTIDEYLSDSTGSINKGQSFTPTVNTTANRLVINIPAAYTFTTNFQYFQFNMTNVPNPDVLIQSSTSYYTNRFYVSMTDSAQTLLYRIYTNADTYSGETLLSPINQIFYWARGDGFIFDPNKYGIDILSYPATNLTNQLIINPGRFNMATFNLRMPTTATILATTTISLTDSVFQTLSSTYIFSPAIFNSLNFHLGCPCSTSPGNYVINFSSSNSLNFIPMLPLMVTINNTGPKASISYSVNTVIPPANSAWIKLFLSEINVDPLIINWIGDPSNDITASIANSTIPNGTNSNTTLTPPFSLFSITNSTALPNQLFKATDPNTCYSFDTNSIKFNLIGTPSSFNNTNLNYSFAFFNSDMDNTLPRNSLAFTINPPLSMIPAYIACSLVCDRMNFPADADILAPKPITIPTLQKSYVNYINSFDMVKIIFNGLVKAKNYKIRCLAQSTEADLTKRIILASQFSNFTNYPNTTLIATPPLSVTTQCVQYSFNSDPGVTVRQALVNYCQQLFLINATYSTNGCMVCSNTDLNYTVPGLSLPNPQSINCVPPASLRLLEPGLKDDKIITEDSQNTKEMRILQSNNSLVNITVCFFQNPLCSTEYTQGYNLTQILNSMKYDLNTTIKFNTKLLISNVPINSFGPILINDTSPPNITAMNGTVIQVNNTGTVMWSLASPLNYSLGCYWKLALSNDSIPDKLAVSQCLDPIWCGYNIVTPAPKTFSVSSITNPFTPNTNYTIYYICNNNIPYSQNLSNVTASLLFYVPPLPSPMPSNVTLPTNISSLSNNTTLSVTYLQNLNYEYIILVLLLLGNIL